jgi:drug/metabolite transporter (DMT)-like permease
VKGGRLLPYAAVAFAACSWGTWALWLRRAEAMGPMPPALESAIVMAVITAGSGVTMVRDRSNKSSSWRARAWVLCLGVSDALNLLLFFAAYRIMISVSVLAHYLTPALVAVAAPVALRERVTPRTLFAVAISVAGLAAMVGRSDAADPRLVWASAAMGAGSAVFYAMNVVVNKLVIDEFTTSEAVFWHGVVATAVLAAFVPAHAWRTVDPHAVLFLAAVALWPGALAGLLFLWALRRMPATHASTLTLLEPVVAVGVAAAVVGEVLDVRALVGGGMILGGSLLVITQTRDRHLLSAASKPVVGDG